LQYGIVALVLDEEFKDRKDELDKLVETAKTSIAITQADKYQKTFEEKSVELDNVSKKWLYLFYGSIIVVSVLFFCIFKTKNSISAAELLNRFFFVTASFFGVNSLLRQHKIHKNQSIIYEQKAMILSTYKELDLSSTGISEDARQRLLEVLTNSIFGLSETGVFKKDSSISSNSLDEIKRLLGSK
jgi:hypothetical protein